MRWSSVRPPCASNLRAANSSAMLRIKRKPRKRQAPRRLCAPGSELQANYLKPIETPLVFHGFSNETLHALCVAIRRGGHRSRLWALALSSGSQEP